MGMVWRPIAQPSANTNNRHTNRRCPAHCETSRLGRIAPLAQKGPLRSLVCTTDCGEVSHTPFAESAGRAGVPLTPRLPVWAASLRWPKKGRSARSFAPLIEGWSPRRPFAKSAGNSRRPAHCETPRSGRIAALALARPAPLAGLHRRLRGGPPVGRSRNPPAGPASRSLRGFTSGPHR